MSYDGFISYSHAADDLLAPRLQAGLQRFAKPWWKRRAVRMFRDEASLSANPHLWSSITEALDESEWFILLLSPEAARSEWVDREVAYWLEHKEPTRIIPVLTDGQFSWSGGVISDAAPPSLYGAFVDEPRWVDLRFARTEEQLDLKNPLFADAVADLAAPLRGVPKDELASEEVRQHRRTVRTAWAAGVALVAVSTAAVFFGLQSADNARTAEANEAEALKQAEVAAEQAAEADRQRVRAEEGEERAELEAAISRMRALVAYSTAEMGNDPELATLLALLAFSIAPEQRYELEALPQLQDAIAANRLLARFDSPADPSAIPYSYNNGVLSADGSTVYASQMLDQGSRVVAIDVETGSVVETYYESDSADPPIWVTASREGLLAFDVAVDQASALEVWVVDTVTGETTTITLSGCSGIWAPLRFSDDGRYLTYQDGTADCEDGGDNDWAVVVDTTTFEQVLIWEKPEAEAESIHIARDSSVALLTSCGTEDDGCLHELVEFPSLAIIQEFIGFVPNLSRSGDRIAYIYSPFRSAFGSTKIVDIPSGDLVTIEDDASGGWLVTGFWPYLLSDDGSRLAFMASPAQRSAEAVTHTVLVVDAEDGSLLASLPRLSLPPLGEQAFYGLSWSADGERLLTSDYQGLRLWDVAPITERAALAEIEDPVEFALRILTRGFTARECGRFVLDPCPMTLNELRNALLGAD